MAIFNSESKKQKNNLIMLQNIVLEIDEKKLQVSEEFLEKMTKIYISKYLKVINETLATMSKVTNIGLLFKKYDYVMANIDALIKIEPLHKFRSPKPSEYKQMLEDRLDHYTMSLISREWRKISPQNNPGHSDVDLERKCKDFFGSFDKYLDRLPEESLATLNRLKESTIPEETPAEGQQPDNAETAPDDGFVPETFETVDSMNLEDEIPPMPEEQ